MRLTPTRHLVTVVCALAALVALAGCGGSGEPQGGAASPSAGAPAPESLAPPTVPDEDPPPCDDIRAGIDAFNAGDPEETVRLFEDALPAAEAYADDEPSRTSDLLLQAVRYYAALPAREYAAALAGSSEFRRHQVTTLTVCRYGGGGPGVPAPSDDAVPA